MNDLSKTELATRKRRFAAALIDVVLVPVVALGLAIVLGLFEHAEDYAGLRPLVSAIAAGIGGYLLMNGWLMRNGQTMGKRLLNIAVYDFAGARVGFWAMFARGMFFPLLYLTLVPPFTILPLVDLGFGMRKDRRCLHDHACRSEVRLAH